MVLHVRLNLNVEGQALDIVLAAEVYQIPSPNAVRTTAAARRWKLRNLGRTLVTLGGPAPLALLVTLRVEHWRHHWWVILLAQFSQSSTLTTAQ